MAQIDEQIIHQALLAMRTATGCSKHRCGYRHEVSTTPAPPLISQPGYGCAPMKVT
jgi:hypothetical protein